MKRVIVCLAVFLVVFAAILPSPAVAGCCWWPGAVVGGIVYGAVALATLPLWALSAAFVPPPPGPYAPPPARRYTGAPAPPPAYSAPEYSAPPAYYAPPAYSAPPVYSAAAVKLPAIVTTRRRLSPSARSCFRRAVPALWRRRHAAVAVGLGAGRGVIAAIGGDRGARRARARGRAASTRSPHRSRRRYQTSLS